MGERAAQRLRAVYSSDPASDFATALELAAGAPRTPPARPAAPSRFASP